MTYDIDIERSLLGTLIHNPGLIDEYRLIDDMFYHATSKKIFDGIMSMHIAGETIDVLAVASRVPKHKMDVAKCNSSYLSPAYAKQHIEILRGLEYRRKIATVGENLKRLSEQPHIDANELDEAQSMLLREHKQKRSKTVLEAVGETINIAERIESGERSGLLSGIWAVDEGIGGLHNSDLIILAARPGVGKSALAGQIAAEVAKVGHVDFFSLEMSAQQLGQRLLCSVAHISGYKIRTGSLSAGEWESMAASEASFADLDLTIHDEPIQNILDIRATCRRSDNLKLIVVDYLQLMSSTDRYQGSRNQQVSEISRSLKALAKEFNVPVLALSQLSRQNEMRESKRPQLSDLRDSGAIEQDADIVCFLHREKKNKDDDRVFIPTHKTELIVAKHRHGPIGSKSMLFETDLAMFKPLGKNF